MLCASLTSRWQSGKPTMAGTCSVSRRRLVLQALCLPPLLPQCQNFLLTLFPLNPSFPAGGALNLRASSASATFSSSASATFSVNKSAEHLSSKGISAVSSDGHVPHRSTSFLDHANRKMVKHSLPQIHPEASTGVFARHLLKNDRGSVFQTRPKPNRNGSDGEHSWRLVFFADGLNWWRQHHRQKDGGGAEPINNWSKPQLSSELYISGISGYLAHILCTFLFCHSEENFHKVDSFGRDSVTNILMGGFAHLD